MSHTCKGRRLEQINRKVRTRQLPVGWKKMEEARLPGTSGNAVWGDLKGTQRGRPVA